MRPRTIILLAVAAVLLAIFVITSLPTPTPVRPAEFAEVVVADETIDTYSFITDATPLQTKKVPVAEAAGAYRSIDEVRGLMTTKLIEKGKTITTDAALPPEVVRYVRDMGFEIISFGADVDKMVGGAVKPGRKINIYGFGRGQGGEPGPVILVEPNVWVVDVRSNAGQAVFATEAARGEEQQPQTQQAGGLLGFGATAGLTQVQPAIITVAAQPEVVVRIIEAFGARGLNAWVTLAGERPPELLKPILQVNPPFLTFTALEKGPDPSAQSLSIANAGGNTLNWTATKKAEWLELSATKGQAPSSLDVSVKVAGLATGTYSDTIEIAGALGTEGSPQRIPVLLTVGQVTPTPTPCVGCPPPTPIPEVTPTIHLVLQNVPYPWRFKILKPEDLELPEKIEGAAYEKDFSGRELTLEVENPTDETLWIERANVDNRAEVVIKDKTKDETGRVYFAPGETGEITIHLVDGATQAVVVLLDGRNE